MPKPASTNYFLDALPSRPAAIIAHFQRRFSVSAVMCRCHRFPVYAQAIGKPKVKAAFFDHLCLDCIHHWCMNNPDLPLWDEVWNESLDDYRKEYYSTFYSQKERDAIRDRQPLAARYRLFDETLTRMEKWLLKRGWKRNRCDDPACLDFECISSVVRVKAGGRK
jgi:hypothetical protein